MFESYALSAEAQLTRERVIQTVESAVQAGEARNLTPGLHQLPVRPITQNGKHTTAAVVTATSLANASGKTFFFFLSFLDGIFCPLNTIRFHYIQEKADLFTADSWVFVAQ